MIHTVAVISLDEEFDLGLEDWATELRETVGRDLMQGRLDPYNVDLIQLHCEHITCPHNVILTSLTGVVTDSGHEGVYETPPEIHNPYLREVVEELIEELEAR